MVVFYSLIHKKKFDKINKKIIHDFLTGNCMKQKDEKKNILNEIKLKLNQLLPSYDAVIIADYDKGLLSKHLIESIISMSKQE